jgi:hypothetical protein
MSSVDGDTNGRMLIETAWDHYFSLKWVHRAYWNLFIKLRNGVFVVFIVAYFVICEFFIALSDGEFVAYYGRCSIFIVNDSPHFKGFILMEIDICL